MDPPSMAGFCRASQDLGSQDEEVESTPISRMTSQVWIGPWQPDQGSCVPLFHDWPFLGQTGPGDPCEGSCTPFWLISLGQNMLWGDRAEKLCPHFMDGHTWAGHTQGCQVLFFVCGSTFRTWALAEGQVSPYLSR